MKIKIILIAIAVLLAGFLFVFSAKYRATTKSEIDSQAEALNGNLGGVDVTAFLKEAHSLEEKGSLTEARDIYQQLAASLVSSQDMLMVQNKIENINMRIVLSGINVKQSQIYEVQPGDSLAKIAKELNTTVDFIKKSNNITNDIIHPGAKLRVWTAPFDIFVDKSQNTLALYSEGEIIKTYMVSTGRNNSTPIGDYTIVNKLIDPHWYKDGKKIPPASPENILGSRWMGFDLPGYGIHGTTVPEDIGKQVTDGCVRMHNSDVEELFDIIPVGTKVTIID